MAAAGIQACQDMSLNLFVPFYVSSVLTGCWMPSHGGPQECREDPLLVARLSGAVTAQCDTLECYLTDNV